MNLKSSKPISAGPLTGVKVTDFTWIGAGSFTTKLLADDVLRLPRLRLG